MAAAKARAMHLRFPGGGLHRQYAEIQQPPFTAPDALNVWPVGAMEYRRRGGSRPGLAKWSEDQLGTVGNRKIRMLSEVEVVRDDGFRTWTDTFMGEDLDAVWTTAGWVGTEPGITDFSEALTDTGAVAVVRDDLTDLDPSQAYDVAMWIAPYGSGHDYQGTFSIYIKLDDSNPAYKTDGVRVLLDFSTNLRCDITEYASGSATTQTGGTAIAASDGPGRLLVHVNGTTVTAYWQGTQVCQKTGCANNSSRTRVGFGMTPVADGAVCLVDSFRVQYYQSAPSEVRRKSLLASAGGKLYVEKDARREMQEVSSSLTLNDGVDLEAAYLSQKSYIADHGDFRALGTDGTISGGTSLDAASVSDWTALGIDTDSDVAYIFNTTGDIEGDTVAIDSVSAGSVTLATSLGGSGNCSYKILRGPKIYDPKTDTLSLWLATSGQVPYNADNIFSYRGRTCLTRNYNVFFSRYLDPLDFDYDASEEDASRAVSFQLTTAARLGGDVRAAAPYRDDYVIFGCRSSLWALVGDPAYGGELSNRSLVHGIVGPRAWCYGPYGEFWFLSANGLCLLEGPTDTPSPVDAALPRALQGLDGDAYSVTLGYYAGPPKGILIHVSREGAKERLHYFYDLQVENGGFWPVMLPETMKPYAVYPYISSAPEDSGLILGGQDGYLRWYKATSEKDDGTDITSYVEYGPIRLAGDLYRQGKILELRGAPADDGGNVSWGLRVGRTHEELRKATNTLSGTWEAGFNHITSVHRSGGAAVLRLAGLNSRRWAMESVVMVVKPAGKQRGV